MGMGVLWLYVIPSVNQKDSSRWIVCRSIPFFVTRRCGVCSIFDSASIPNFHRTLLKWQCLRQFCTSSCRPSSLGSSPHFSLVHAFSISKYFVGGNKIGSLD